MLRSTTDSTEITGERSKIPRAVFEVPDELLSIRDKSPLHATPIVSDGLSSSQSSSRSTHDSQAVITARLKGKHNERTSVVTSPLHTNILECIVVYFM